MSTRVAELLEAAGIPWKYDHERGFDHGVFIPLKVAFPNANVPIVQVSLLANMDAAAHLRIGEALAPLRDEGVLIIGSGMTYHNMRTLMASMRRGANGRGADEGSQRFDDWLEEVLTKAPPKSRASALASWDKAPSARDAHPREEHLLPLHVVVGAAGDDAGKRTLKDVVMGAVEFGVPLRIALFRTTNRRRDSGDTSGQVPSSRIAPAPGRRATCRDKSRR